MPFLEREDFLKSVNDRIGEDTSEESLSFIANMSDTYDELTRRAASYDELNGKYENLKKEYKERFFNTETKEDADETADIEDDQEEKILTYDDLFKTEE